MVIGLDRLRHNAVVGGHNKDNDVCRVGAPGAHSGKSFMARRIQEGNAPFRKLDFVGAYMLRDTAMLGFSDLGAADHIQKRRLAVINVPHKRHNRGTTLPLIAFSSLLNLVDDLFGFLGKNQFIAMGLKHFGDDLWLRLWLILASSLSFNIRNLIKSLVLMLSFPPNP
jgi:hypothetical protein